MSSTGWPSSSARSSFDTPASPSRREGIEWNNHWRVAPGLLLDADLAFSRARFTQHDPAGDFVPGSVGRVMSLGATVPQRGRWFGQSLRLGRLLGSSTRVALDVFNLFNRRASDIDYFYTSRLPGEAAGGVGDIHLHPVEPRAT